VIDGGEVKDEKKLGEMLPAFGNAKTAFRRLLRA